MRNHQIFVGSLSFLCALGLSVAQASPSSSLSVNTSQTSLTSNSMSNTASSTTSTASTEPPTSSDAISMTQIVDDGAQLGSEESQTLAQQQTATAEGVEQQASETRSAAQDMSEAGKATEDAALAGFAASTAASAAGANGVANSSQDADDNEQGAGASSGLHESESFVQARNHK